MIMCQQHRKGIEAEFDLPRAVKNPRQDKEPLTIQVIVTSDDLQRTSVAATVECSVNDRKGLAF
jgi:hypothetical protein